MRKAANPIKIPTILSKEMGVVIHKDTVGSSTSPTDITNKKMDAQVIKATPITFISPSS